MSDESLLISYDQKARAFSIFLSSHSLIHFSPTVVKKLRLFQDSLVSQYMNKPWQENLYLVWRVVSDVQARTAYKNRGVMKNGFGNGRQFEQYLTQVFDLILLNYINLKLPIKSISILDQYVLDLSKEFLLMSDVCFFITPNCNGIEKVNVSSSIKNLLFDDSVYDKKHQYFANNIQWSQFKRLISASELTLFNEDEIEKYRQYFNQVRENIDAE